ncbi:MULTISPECIES: HpcH/HpaI aldolase/citrate lyase family protein [Brevibacterium]|uniref:CoA ester lyase n=1 Tax=Brevibacterium salitolerans TaxID=1403566 RepID=A0ABP5IA67_9MICO|nr:CoA ester lyase [Brevibacterium sp.]
MRTQPLRSMLFVPGGRLSLIDKARRSGADAVIIDLEDAVPASSKASAREEVAEFLRSVGDDDYPFFVRVNDLSSAEAGRDIAAIVGPGLTGVVVPKVSTGEDIRFVERLLRWTEADAGATKRTLITPVLETAQAIRNAYELCAASERVAYVGGLGVKGGDVERELGYRWTPAGAETFTLRSNVLVDVRAAGVRSPVCGLWTDIDDLEGLERFAEENRQLGYEGMIAIHPSHIATINRVFTPTAEELDHDRRLIAAMDQAAGGGTGAVVFEGRMIDEAMAETSRLRLRRFASDV